MASERTTLEVARVRRRLMNGEVAAVRQASGLTRSDVGRALGVSPATVSRWEAGVRSPRPEIAVRLARLLDRLEAVS